MAIQQTKKYKEIKDSLLDQLKRSGLEEKYYLDLVDDYMHFWSTKMKLQADIDERGVAVPYNNGGGQYGVKKNDSVGEHIKVTGQMLTILDKLGIKPEQSCTEEDEPL